MKTIFLTYLKLYNIGSLKFVLNRKENNVFTPVAINGVVKYYRDAIHIKKGSWDAIQWLRC